MTTGPGGSGARAGLRIAALGATVLDAAGRVRGLSSAAGNEARERARLLRDVSRRVLSLHGVETEARGALPLGPALLASNHLSWLDPLVVAGLVPCAPISKLEVSRWPFVGALARELGVIFVQRGDARSGTRVIGEAEQVLASEVSVLNFPEGTTTDGTGVLPFRKGLFRLAASRGVPVVPVALAYDPPEQAWVGDATFVPHYLAFAKRPRTRALVSVGAPIPAEADPAALAVKTRAEVARLLAELR